MTQDYGPRVPKDYTSEMRQDAIKHLHDEDLVLLDFLDACVLLDISKTLAYALARKDELPGAARIGDHWRVRREVLRKFLYGEE
jgi:excisionase family DNA binding protein